jgi:hypothetical protein
MGTVSKVFRKSLAEITDANLAETMESCWKAYTLTLDSIVALQQKKVDESVKRGAVALQKEIEQA